MDPRLDAFLTHAGQSATGGWQDEAVSAILARLPLEDATGIPRHYAEGSAEEQYKSGMRRDAAELARRYPGNAMAGSFVGAAPAAIATGALGGAPAIAAGVGLGGLSGAGTSEATGTQLVRDTVAGAALGGAGAAAGNAITAGAPTAKAALQAMWRGGPPSAGAPALAGAAVRGGAAREAAAAPAQINQMSARSLPKEVAAAEKATSVAPSTNGASVNSMADQTSFDLPGPRQGPVPDRYYATHDPSAPLTGQGERSADVFAVPGFTDKKYVVKTGPDGKVARIFSTDATSPTPQFPGLPEPEWLTNFGKIPYEDDAMKALRGNMPREGEGGTRLAVGFEGENGNPYVRKIAKNESGRRANAYEADMSETRGFTPDRPGTRPLEPIEKEMERTVRKPTLLAPVTRGDGNKYLDMQKLQRVSDKDLVKRFDLGDRKFIDVMSDWLNHGKRLPAGNAKWDAFQAELDQLREAMPGIGDIEHARQWGVDPNGELRLLDYGWNATTPAPKAVREAVQRELPHTGKQYNYHATAPQNVPGIAETGLDPNRSGANFPWAGKKNQTFFAPREHANAARKLVADIENFDVDPTEIRMLRTTRKTEPISGKKGVTEKVQVRSEPTSADDIEILNKKGQWVNIRDVLPKGQPPSPPDGLSREQLLKWWGSMLGMSGLAGLRMKGENQ